MRVALMATALVAVLAAPTWAQDSNSTDRMAEMIGRMLGLDDGQMEKAKEIFKKQNEQLRAILTDDQKQRFDQASRFLGGGGGPGGRGGFGSGRGGRSGGFGGGGLPSTDELKTQLGLSDEQVTKIDEVRDNARQEIREFAQGRPAPDKWQEFLPKFREKVNGQIRNELKDDQKTKFDEIVKQADERRQQFSSRFGSGRSSRGGRGGSPEERAASIVEELRISDSDEAAAIGAVIKKVLEAQSKYEEHRRSYRRSVDELSRNEELNEDALQAKLKELRAQGTELESALAKARKTLSEVVNIRQEIILIRRGVLQ